jgi:hypothetical protein
MFLHDFLSEFSVLIDRMLNALCNLSILCLQVGLLSNYIYIETYTQVGLVHLYVERCFAAFEG